MTNIHSLDFQIENVSKDKELYEKLKLERDLKLNKKGKIVEIFSNLGDKFKAVNNYD